MNERMSAFGVVHEISKRKRKNPGPLGQGAIAGGATLGIGGAYGAGIGVKVANRFFRDAAPVPKKLYGTRASRAGLRVGTGAAGAGMGARKFLFPAVLAGGVTAGIASHRKYGKYPYNKKKG